MSDIPTEDNSQHQCVHPHSGIRAQLPWKQAPTAPPPCHWPSPASCEDLWCCWVPLGADQVSLINVFSTCGIQIVWTQGLFGEMLYKPDRAFREPEISKQLGEKFSMNEKANHCTHTSNWKISLTIQSNFKQIYSVGNDHTVAWIISETQTLEIIDRYYKHMSTKDTHIHSQLLFI